MVPPGSEPLLEQVSREVGSGVHMVSLGEVPPRHLLPTVCFTPVPSNRLDTCSRGFDYAWGKWRLPLQVGISSVKEGN